MSDERPLVFFAYPSEPTDRGDAVRIAAAELGGDSKAIRTRTWEVLDRTGLLVIHKVLESIDEADLSVFEVTDLNENVMFELGYAIGKNKRTWLLRDVTVIAARRSWDEFGTLASVGYQQYVNATDIEATFYKEWPLIDGETVFDQLIRPALVASNPSILHIPSLYSTQASLTVGNRLAEERSRGLRYERIDPSEPVQPLGTLAQQILSAAAVVIHFTSPEREGASTYNARLALTAGLTLGMDRPLLILADTSYRPAFDYRDLLHVYQSTRDLAEHLETWLKPLLASAHETFARSQSRHLERRQAEELARLHLGSYVAEYEADTLGGYFVETPAFNEVLTASTMVFVGRRGYGKTANFLQAIARLQRDAGNVVAVVKPLTYEWQGLLRVLQRFDQRDSRVYLLQAVWRYLLLSEIANAVIADVGARTQGPQEGTPEWDLVRFAEGEAAFIAEDFSVRLDAALARLEEVPKAAGIADERRLVAEALHEHVLHRLEKLLAQAIRRRHRIALLVDNLDKGWQRDTDLDLLAQFLLALLTSLRELAEDLQGSSRPRSILPVTVAVFLRTDIFARVVRTAREPDKIPVFRMGWKDPRALLRVVEDRFVSARGENADPNELWEKFFCARVRGIPTTEYITWRTLPRPRDVVYLCNYAIAEAAQKGKSQVEEDDILAAEEIYSQFAYTALVVEDTGTTPALEAVLYKFVGESPVLSEETLLERIASGKHEGDTQEFTRYLRELSFLGIETDEEVFSYSDNPLDFPRDEALASKLASRRGAARRYVVHPAFRPHLGIPDNGDRLLPRTQLKIFAGDGDEATA